MIFMNKKKINLKYLIQNFVKTKIYHNFGLVSLV